MQYVVEVVADGELPEGVDLVIVERRDDSPLLLLSGRPARAWNFLREWEGRVESPTEPSVLRLAG